MAGIVLVEIGSDLVEAHTTSARMAFRFRLTEPFQEGFRRIARDQIERAQCLLKEADNPATAVHETRKSLKRLRALLRLVRPALGDPIFREQNAQLRDIGRSLSSARDRHVLAETLTKLEADSAIARKGLGQVMRELLNRKNGKAPTVDPAAVKQAQRRLSEAKRQLVHMQLSGSGFEVVGPGLQASYHKARRAFHNAYLERTDENFHEFRKGTQQHWRHMMLLSRAWPGCLNARVSEARALSQILGDDHDLAMLISFTHRHSADALSGQQISTLEKLARQRQDELRALARPKGTRLFAESAKSLHRRMAAYWDAAVALKEYEPDEDEPRQEPKAPSRQPAKRKRASATRARL